MEQKIIEKITRYLELSKEFTKTENEVFPVEKTNCCNQGGVLSFIETSYRITPKPSRSEEIMIIAKAKASKSDRYDEYLKLQGDLFEYFQVLNKITK